MRESAIDRARSIIAYGVAYRLLYHSARYGYLSPVAATRRKIDDLKGNNAITEEEHNQLTGLLDTLVWCELDREERIDDLARELALDLATWHEEFPTEELERLETLA